MEWQRSAQIRKGLIAKCAKAGIPVGGTFELTPRCNLRCRMCYVRLTPEQMVPIGRERTATEWLELARQAKEAGMTFLLLTGGEPTLRTDFLEIYEGLAQMGFSISMNSNGTLFTKEIKELFHRMPPSQVNITLYGTSREEYEELCGNPEAFDHVKDTLHWLREEGILIHLNTTMTPGNVEKWKAFEEFAKNEGIRLRMTTYCFPPVRRSECSEFERLEPEIAGELSVKDIFYREGIKGIKRRFQDMQNIQVEQEDNTMKCAAAKSHFWVNWNGDMVPCTMLSCPVTHPFEEGFDTAWKDLREETDRIRLCSECVACPERKTCINCAAVTHTETGEFHKKPEYMCRMNHAYREALKQYSSLQEQNGDEIL